MSKANWWKNLSYQEQKDYLEAHPNSKRKLTRRKPRTTKGNDHQVALQNQLLTMDDLEGVEEEQQKYVSKMATLDTPTPGLLKRMTKYVINNPGKVALGVGSALATRRTTVYDKGVDGMAVERRDSLANMIRGAIHLKDSKALQEITIKTGIKFGILFAGAIALSAFTGVDVTLALPLLAEGFWNIIPDTTDSKEYLHNVGKAYEDTINKNMKDPEMVSKALRHKKSAQVENVEDVEEEASFKAGKFDIPSNHESDLNKVLARIEKVDIASKVRKINQLPVERRVKALVEQASFIEQTIPSIASILIVAVPQRLSLSNRAKSQLNLFSAELNRCKVELSSMAVEKAGKRSPLGQLLAKSIQYDKYQASASYASCEDSKIRHCELHTFEQVETSSGTFSKVEVYCFVEKANLYISSVIDSNFIPNHFAMIKPRNLNNWLKEAGLVG